MTSQCGKATFCDKELHSLNPPEDSTILREKKCLRIVRKRTKHAVLLRYGVVLWDYQINKFNLKGE
ncbi:hypothetical protein D8939_00465 [Campylobacter jejuni]|nr:hypothetical protein [Campylobacter jejuni]EAH5367259.1 hypothetical protein [Campylobacter jejuni]